MHELIVSPFMGEYLVLRPGFPKGVQIAYHRYQELVEVAGRDAACPAWLADAARRAWKLEISGRPLDELAIVRAQSRYEYGRASYELNLGCNYACKHCYLGLKEFAGLVWPDRERLLHILRDAGVLWLQLTGGEPMIDKFFAAVYSMAHELGMIIEILTNGSRLSNPLMLDLLTTRRPHRITLSVYGATEESYDALTQRRGAYKAFIRGLTAAHEADLPLELSVIITNDNAHEIDKMHAIAEGHGVPSRDYVNMSPTIYGGRERVFLPSPLSTSGSVHHSPAAMQDTHFSTSIHSGKQASARWAASHRSRFCRKVSLISSFLLKLAPRLPGPGKCFSLARLVCSILKRWIGRLRYARSL